MNERSTSRVTLDPRFDTIVDCPRNGLRNGTRNNAAPSCPPIAIASTAAIGADAVFTSGRLPITIPAV